MKKTRFIKTHNPQGKPQLKFAENKRGVYVIAENGKITYIGSSYSKPAPRGKTTKPNLRATILRHFRKWQEVSEISGRPLYHTTYAKKMKRNNYTVRVIITNTDKQAERLEIALILKHRPRDNKQKYDQYKIDFNEKKVVETYENTGITPITDIPF